MNGAKKQNAEILLQSWGDSRWKCHFRKMYVKDVAIRFEYKTKLGVDRVKSNVCKRLICAKIEELEKKGSWVIWKEFRCFSDHF